MKTKLFAMTMILGMAIAPAFGQSKTAFKAPRTVDGVPDLQGVYSNSSDVPLERAQNLGDKEVYSAEEMAQRAAATAGRGNARRDPGVHYDTAQFGLGRVVTADMANNRTSVLSGPTGRVPATLAAAQERMNAERAAARGHEYDGPENRGIAERCIYWGAEGPPMMPQGYNANIQIVQGPGYVTVLQEMIHDVRVIPTDGRAHLPSPIRQWFGDSVGHWEGDTLVVDTSNFNDQPALGRGSDHNLHVVERFTMTGPKTLKYQFTVTDPTTWEQSWSGEYPMGKIDGAIYEYACQEGNEGMLNILKEARAEDRKAAAETAQK